jgi:hypothetical protein
LQLIPAADELLASFGVMAKVKRTCPGRIALNVVVLNDVEYL